MEVEVTQPVEGNEGQNAKEENLNAGGLGKCNNSDIAEENVKKTDEKETASGEGSDVYAYTKREEFTSENFKIELRGLPRYYNIGVRKMAHLLSWWSGSGGYHHRW